MTGCLLDYNYFKKNYELIAVDLSRQRELDADPRAIQQIEFNAKNQVKRIPDIRKIKRNNIRILQRNFKSHVNKLRRKFNSQKE